MSELTYRIDQFEGPLDLLLMLISKNKIDIEDIPIAMLCDQYLEYLNNCIKMDMDIASEFLVMASELVLIKTRFLLPAEEGSEEDPRADLAAALLEYSRMKSASPILLGYYDIFKDRYVKDTDEFPPDNSVPENQSIDRLIKAMRAVLTNIRSDREDDNVAIKPIIRKTSFPISVKIDQIRTSFSQKKSMRFEDLFVSSESKSEIIATFIAILELIKSGYVSISDKVSDSPSSIILDYNSDPEQSDTVDESDITYDGINEKY